MNFNILGHTVSVTLTDDLNELTSEDTLGRYNIFEQRILINDKLLPSARDEAVFHEFHEYLIAYLGQNYNHKDFKKFSSIFWAVLKANGMLTENWLEEKDD